ncbi:MAG: hypothetical protein JKY15_00305 [Deltaproteobacteria bacterium]|nr:hypothetical protein [Deltaproteobacteria bacterium]
MKFILLSLALVSAPLAAHSHHGNATQALTLTSISIDTIELVRHIASLKAGMGYHHVIDPLIHLSNIVEVSWLSFGEKSPHLALSAISFLLNSYVVPGGCHDCCHLDKNDGSWKKIMALWGVIDSLNHAGVAIAAANSIATLLWQKHGASPDNKPEEVEALLEN